MKTSHLPGVLEVLRFLEKLKLSNHLVNENKINLRIPKILHVDCAYLPIVHIKANIFDNFLSFSILSLMINLYQNLGLSLILLREEGKILPNTNKWRNL